MDKNEHIQRLTNHLQNKYGAINIIVADYWDGDNDAIGLVDKTKTRTVYISTFGRPDNIFFVSLEDPPTSAEFPYTPAGDFDNLSAEDVEKILITHLKIA